MSTTIFDSGKEPLSRLLDEAVEGKLQLPDFQRGWVWDDYGIRSLLASVSQSFPVGAIMTLRTGGEVRFQPRSIEGLTFANPGPQPERLLLDGQQRLTSLYQATRLHRAIDTLNTQRRAIKRWDERVDIHHIFPRDWCKKQQIEAGRYDCVVNKTPISARANRIIGGVAPSVYLKRLQQDAKITDERTRQILASHLIDAEALLSDNFEHFFEQREEALIGLIEAATGKRVARVISQDEPVGEVMDEEEPDELSA